MGLPSSRKEQKQRIGYERFQHLPPLAQQHTHNHLGHFIDFGIRLRQFVNAGIIGHAVTFRGAQRIDVLKEGNIVEGVSGAERL